MTMMLAENLEQVPYLSMLDFAIWADLPARRHPLLHLINIDQDYCYLPNFYFADYSVKCGSLLAVLLTVT
jgi:hypothetical protein